LTSPSLLLSNWKSMRKEKRDEKRKLLEKLKCKSGKVVKSLKNQSQIRRNLLKTTEGSTKSTTRRKNSIRH